MQSLIFLGLILLFFIPSFLMMRKQRAHQARVDEVQRTVAVGDRVVTGAGFHGTLTNVDGAVLGMEIAPGLVVEIERAAILKKAEPSAPTITEGNFHRVERDEL
ncbi:preprotein translocase subunit YajC [Corynebacterium tapiri]|uniref:Preprotein translocase subunit YajC n=1 Tax=Corynebacterium tapiri TaxID=1448266 RepID=A0A5C4U5A3_9CORY|nr:preprotein translocase subunit YajC [Corynebacterium tapiri]TNL97747.1 preprotein translocase subunit YajC [Corynebacterium tapiri]